MQLPFANTKNNTTSLEKSEQSYYRYILLYSPILVAFVVMLPRLLSAQFGLLDDGLTLLVAQEVKENWGVAFRFTEELEKFFLVNQGGRFFPAYWLFFAGLYGVIGPNPFLSFLFNYIMLAGITAGLIWLVQFRGGSKTQAWAAGLFFVLSGPVIENFYTLSKSEPPQLLWLGASLLLILVYVRSQGWWQKIVTMLAVVLSLLLANLTKETAIVLIPISLGWVLLDWRRAKTALGKNFSTRQTYLLASLSAGVIFFGLRWYFLPLSLAEGSYTSFYRLEWPLIVASAIRWGAWLIRDFFYLIPFAFFMGVLTFLGKQTQGRLLLETIIWLLGWIALFLPWHSLQEYYLLPFALGSAVFGGLSFGQLLSTLSLASQNSLRGLAAICLGLALAPLPVMLANNLTNARVQLAVDAANTDLINFLATLPPNSKVMLNLGSINEYVIKTEPLLSLIKDRPDITLDYFEFQVASPAKPELEYYVATPEMKNQTLPSVRIAVNEYTSTIWNEPFYSFLGQQPDMLFQTERQVNLFDIGLHRLGCQLFGLLGADGLFCSTGRPLIDTRTFSYSWKVYRVSSHVNTIALPAVFLPHGVWQLQKTDGTTATVLFGQLGDRPVVGDWNGDRFTGIGVFRPENLTWYLDNNIDGKADYEFQFTGMQATDIPLAGDWDGNGTATAGYFRPENSSWHFRNNNSSGKEEWPVIQLGSSTDIPLAGDWDGDGRDTIGIYRPNAGRIELWNDPSGPVILSADPKSRPVIGHWAGHGFDSIAFVVDGQWSRRFFNCNCQPSNVSEPFKFGAPEGIPLGGRWLLNK